MKYSEIETLLKEILLTSNEENKWVNLAEIGILLRQRGIPYAKLSNFLRSFGHLLELKYDEQNPPISYVRLKTK